MIIDFHTHTFPDRIAAQTVAHLAELGGITPHLDGTLAALKRSMAKAGIDRSVILPVATAPRQVESINRTAAQLNGKDGILYAGAIHPDCENVEEILDGIRDAGLFGIKLHPDYQGVYFDDDRYLRILEAAARRGLITVTHAGLDVGYPNDIHCTPDMVLHVLEALKGTIDSRLVLAHLGGCNMAGEVLEKLVGKPVYMDTAVVLNWYPEQALEIIRSHGSDKILFATDSPWADQREFVELVRGFGLNEAEQEQIFWKNAAKLLRLTDFGKNHDYHTIPVK